MGRCIIPCLFFIGLILQAQPKECSLKRNADGIIVFTCKAEKETLKSLRAEFELENTTVLELKDFLWDVNNYRTWQYNVIESEVVANTGEDEMSYRVLVDSPWPLDNREVVANMKVVNGQTMTRIFIHSIPHKKPTPNNVIHVPLFDASWEVVSVGNNLKVSYALRIDPGGSVPSWLVNLAMAEGPHISFRELKKQLVK